MQIRIIKPGILTTVQDLGRSQHLAQAVPVSGAMDSLSARIANIALGNAENAAVIEFTYATAMFRAEADLLIAIAGEGAIFKAGDNQLPTYRPVFVPSGTIISLHHHGDGARSYLAVVGGWDVSLVLGSRSTYIIAGFGGRGGRALQADDVLQHNQQLSETSKRIWQQLKGDQVNYTRWYLPMQLLLPADKRHIRVIPANEFTWFNSRSIVDFLTEPFQLDLRSNRMGYQLEGPLMERTLADELLSTAVAPGTIQVTGSGALVLLMADCQTTGGYPRIAQVAHVDLPLCAQLKPGDAIFFKETGRQEAEMLYLEREKELQLLTQAVTNRYL